MFSCLCGQFGFNAQRLVEAELGQAQLGNGEGRVPGLEGCQGGQVQSQFARFRRRRPPGLRAQQFLQLAPLAIPGEGGDGLGTHGRIEIVHVDLHEHDVGLIEGLRNGGGQGVVGGAEQVNRAEHHDGIAGASQFPQGQGRRGWRPKGGCRDQHGQG